MPLMDLVRETWEDLRGTPKEEQKTASVGQSVTDSPGQWAKDYKAAVTPGESIEPVALDRGIAGNIATLALDSEPARLKRVENLLDHGSTENVPSVERSTGPDSYAERGEPTHYRPSPEALPTGGNRWETLEYERPYVPLHDAATTARLEEQNVRLSTAVGPKHDQEFRYEAEHGDIMTYKHEPSGNRIHLDSNADFNKMEEGRAPIPTTRAEILNSYQEPSAEVSATLSPEHRQQWAPLEKELGFNGADAFRHYETRDTVQVYMTETKEGAKLIGLDDKAQFYDVESKGVPTAISREEALRHVQVEPHFYTPPEHSVREALGTENAPDFLPGAKSGDIQTYHHVPTAGYVHLDSEGKFYNADREVISRDEALHLMQTTLPQSLAPPSPSSAVTLPHEGTPHLPTADVGKVQPAVQEQSISM